MVVNNLDEFEMNNLNITSLSGADNREIIIDEASIGGAPAVDLDNTAGTLSNLVIDCGGSGTAITAHHGGNFQHLWRFLIRRLHHVLRE